VLIILVFRIAKNMKNLTPNSAGPTSLWARSTSGSTPNKSELMQIKCSITRAGKLELKTLEPTFEYKDKHGVVNHIDFFKI